VGPVANFLYSYAFQMAKEQLVLAFHKAELGTWLKKPIEQDQFELDDSVLNHQ
jgi:hypothetical protein